MLYSPMDRTFPRNCYSIIDGLMHRSESKVRDGKVVGNMRGESCKAARGPKLRATKVGIELREPKTSKAKTD
jgi:hypothetical protein